jgi:LacI family transcriptional regulator
VLSDHPDVSDGMRERVLGAVDQLGYRPNMLAQSMRQQKTRSVGFTMSDIGNPVLAATVTGAERAFSRAGYSMLVTDAEGDPALDVARIEVLQQRRVDGLLLSLSDERDPATVKTLEALEIPSVLVDRYQPRGFHGPEVRFDHRSGMRSAAQHLWELGHRRVAVILGGARRPARERLKGIEDVFGEPGELAIFAGSYTIEHGSQAVTHALAAAEPPTAIIAAANLFMHGALRALRDRGLVVGRDVSFVGCDDVAVAEFHDPPIALVRRDTRQIGDVAARVLLAELGAAARVPEAERLLPTTFQAQASCGEPRRNRSSVRSGA